MRLAEWRISQSWTQQQLAAALGCNQASVSYLERTNGENRGQIPKRELMLSIFRVTRGAVTPNDFYALPPLDQLTLPLVHLEAAPLLERMSGAASDDRAAPMTMAEIDDGDDGRRCESAQ